MNKNKESLEKARRAKASIIEARKAFVRRLKEQKPLVSIQEVMRICQEDGGFSLSRPTISKYLSGMDTTPGGLISDPTSAVDEKRQAYSLSTQENVRQPETPPHMKEGGYIRGLEHEDYGREGMK